MHYKDVLPMNKVKAERVLSLYGAWLTDASTDRGWFYRGWIIILFGVDRGRDIVDRLIYRIHAERRYARRGA